MNKVYKISVFSLYFPLIVAIVMLTYKILLMRLILGCTEEHLNILFNILVVFNHKKFNVRSAVSGPK